MRGRISIMMFGSVLGRQWVPRTPEDLANQAARVAANNARSTFPKTTARELRLEKLRADADTD